MPLMVAGPMTTREKQADKIAAFRCLMRKQGAKSNPKGRGQVTLGAAKSLRPMGPFVISPSAAGNARRCSNGRRK